MANKRFNQDLFRQQETTFIREALSSFSNPGYSHPECNHQKNMVLEVLFDPISLDKRPNK